MGALVLLGVPAYVGDTSPTFWELVVGTLQVYAAVGAWALMAAVMSVLIMRPGYIRTVLRRFLITQRRRVVVTPVPPTDLDEAGFSFARTASPSSIAASIDPIFSGRTH